MRCNSVDGERLWTTWGTGAGGGPKVPGRLASPLIEAAAATRHLSRKCRGDSLVEIAATKTTPVIDGGRQGSDSGGVES
jgi:hypothetical protein